MKASQEHVPPLTPGRARSISFSTQNHSAALVDIDQTLLFDAKTKGTEKIVRSSSQGDIVSYINPAVIKFLKAHKIKDIYLFTKMRNFSFNNQSGSVHERSAVIQYLRECDLTVHGVITPQDYTLHVPLDELKGFQGEYDKRYNEALADKTLERETFLQNTPAHILMDMPETFPTLKRLYDATQQPNNTGDFREQRWIGDAFSHAILHQSDANLFEWSLAAQQVSDLLLCTNSSASKTNMFRQFMRQGAQRFRDIYILDDLKPELEEIAKIRDQYKPDIHLFHIAGIGEENIMPYAKKPKLKQHSAGEAEEKDSLHSSASSLRFKFGLKTPKNSPPSTPPSRQDSDDEGNEKRKGLFSSLRRLGKSAK